MSKLSISHLALLTALAVTIQVFESFIFRVIPLPFIRIGLSNVVILFLVWNNHPLSALVVNVSKSLLGGLVTLTLLSPSTLLSLGGGLAAIAIMVLARWLRLGLGLFGVSILGAIAHNMSQLILVRWLLIKSPGVFMLTPILLLIALVSGSLIAFITHYFNSNFRLLGSEINDTIQ